MYERRIVVDTNVFVSALISRESAPSGVLRLCFEGVAQPVMGTTLYMEYHDVCARTDIFRGSALNAGERADLLDAFMACCLWVSVYYLWRPNLPDENDNHLVELALAGNAATIVTGNAKDFRRGDLLFPELEILSPADYIHTMRSH